MNSFNWIKKESHDVTGQYDLQTLINQLATTYKTDIVVHKQAKIQNNDDKYWVEVWYNADSMCYVINVYKKIYD